MSVPTGLVKCGAASRVEVWVLAALVGGVAFRGSIVVVISRLSVDFTVVVRSFYSLRRELAQIFESVALRIIIL
jgi:hypothetical protein